MQERRILLFLSKEDIPNSAKIPQAGDSCNVVWIPVGLDNGNLQVSAGTLQQTIYVELPVLATFPQKPRGNSSISITSKYVSFLNNNSHTVLIYYILAGTRSYSNTYSVVVNYNSVYLGYIKLKFEFPTTISSVTHPDEYPFYVDTEE